MTKPVKNFFFFFFHVRSFVKGTDLMSGPVKRNKTYRTGQPDLISTPG